jgi:hypothetical protein
MVVPSDDLKEARAKSQDFIPALKPEQVGWEDSILGVGDLRAKMWREPDGDWGDIVLAAAQRACR